MAERAFADLIGRLLEAMGQRMDAVRPVPEGILFHTSDGFLFAFVEDPDRISLATVQSFLREVAPTPSKLVVLTEGHLPPALGIEVTSASATLVEGGRFHELVKQLGLASWLGDEPPPTPGPRAGRLLPSAQELDQIMHRARAWLDWGVPALALRFYRHAAALKPEFAPARVGIGRSLLALGLVEDANRAFEETLALHPADLDARLGKASVLGTSGRVDQEVALYRKLLEEDPGRVEVRTHLIAALIAQGHWSPAKTEVDRLLVGAPEDPQLRFLRSVALEKTGSLGPARSERERARRLGLTPERESALCVHLGLPVPEVPATPVRAGARVTAHRAAPRTAPRRPKSKPGRAKPRRGRKPK
ncbi:MAG TPA: tetratricopeptide repeat protein [Thermoplasmata archaeon]